MKTLKISKEISLPLDAVTQTLAAIGRKGAGKSYLATMIAEQMLDAKAQVVVIDPVGIWWGLRVGADGKSKGKEIFVIGGDHGDVPLVPEAGARIAQLVVEKGISVVIDVSSFRIGEHKRFVADFGEEFFHLKKSHRSPVHVFVEEAQKVIPQMVRPEEARMVGAFEQIVRLGRNYGIGCTLITQRPQSVNKEVLSQVECLCVLQVTGPHERKALEAWVQEAGADRKLVGELPSLARGEGYVWSPSWLRIYQRVHFSKKQTFDASATPEVGKATRAASLSSVDVKKLREDMADVVAKAEKDDPIALRKTIAHLQKTIDVQKPVQAPDMTQAIIVAKAETAREWKSKLDLANKEIARLTGKLSQIGKLANEETVMIVTGPIEITPVMVTPGNVRKVIERTKEAVIATTTGIPGAEQRILDAIAWFANIGVQEPEKAAVALLADMKPTSGHFKNCCGGLRSKGLVEYAGANIFMTDDGRAMAQSYDAVSSNADLHERVLARLDSAQKRIMEALLSAYPGVMETTELAIAAGFPEPSGHFKNVRGSLKTCGLIEYPSTGTTRARDILFPL